MRYLSFPLLIAVAVLPGVAAAQAPSPGSGQAYPVKTVRIPARGD